RKGDKVVDEGGLASQARSDRLGGHVASVDTSVAGERSERGRVARHLEVCIFENVLVAVEASRFLVEAGERLDLRLNLIPDLPGEIVSGDLQLAAAFPAHK